MHSNNEIGHEEIEKEGIQNIVVDLKRKSLDNVLSILSRSDLKKIDFDRLLSFIAMESKSYIEPREFRHNGTYILILHFLKLSDENLRQFFIFTLIENAEKYPLMTFCLLYDLKAFSIEGFSEINKIKELFRILNEMKVPIG